MWKSASGSRRMTTSQSDRTRNCCTTPAEASRSSTTIDTFGSSKPRLLENVASSLKASDAAIRVHPPMHGLKLQLENEFAAGRRRTHYNFRGTVTTPL